MSSTHATADAAGRRSARDAPPATPRSRSSAASPAGLARHLGVPGAVGARGVRAGDRARRPRRRRCTPGSGWCCPPTPASRPARPGLESASRGGRRPGRIRRLADVGPAIALAALGLGVILVLEAVLGRGAVFWPIAHRRWSASRCCGGRPTRCSASAGSTPPAGSTRCGWSFGCGGWASYARVGAGVACSSSPRWSCVGVDGGSLGEARDVARRRRCSASSGSRSWSARGSSGWPPTSSDERAERIRTQERADVAAHLHDSVLQTLALIQKNADDAADGRPAGPRPGARPALLALRRRVHRRAHRRQRAARRAAAEVEDEHGVSVDVVAVGDCDLDEPLRPIVARDPRGGHQRRQARRAPAGSTSTPRSPTRRVDVFVRDRGARLRPRRRCRRTGYGVRRSILDRMERHGGTAEVRSAPGEGTEVRLHLPVPSTTGGEP